MDLYYIIAYFMNLASAIKKTVIFQLANGKKLKIKLIYYQKQNSNYDITLL